MYYLMFTVLLLLHPWVPTGAFNSSIIGGREAKPHSRPYMASLQIDNQHVCGGFLVREDFVLTAAHCYKDRALTVVLGAHNLKVKEKSQQKIEVKQFYKHKLNSLDKYNFDVMLLKLAKNATLNKNVKVIGLPRKQGDVPAKTKCTVAGWGKKHNTGGAENVLQEVTVIIEDMKDCKKVWKEYVNKRMLCTNFNGQRGMCQGDSGGPLLCNTKAQGIAAFTGQNCEDPTRPQVYMKIASLIPWIKETME
ncbi:CATG protein, partial [Polyodon spathula]|nr:cathepsin G-like [Polyodon spathula]MBN3271262.1 CATG protein [Polyodon spathula]